MTSSRRTDTSQFESGSFRPHGSMQLQQTGHLNILEATGPFNKELVIAADAAQESLYAALMQKGRWGTVLIFRQSALASPEVLSEIMTILKRRVAQGYIPVAVARVFGPEVEGAQLMQQHYLNAYRGAGIDGRIFSDELSAKEWVASVFG
ncbi:MAG: hypothetical protein HYX43_09020 [Burkholderiales bacterium]|nr:hypothetical protein [Burkholderiales bacterium]